ncbi:MAG: type II toxin-antitoxin system PemK/MazF family toxin [Candidatus Altiarchaeia archaeon]
MLKPGDVVLAMVQYTDTFEVKQRPAVVLYEEFDNIVIAGITSNTAMKGIPLTKEEGAVRDSVIKLNYIFTISRAMIIKSLFALSAEKKKRVYEELTERLVGLKN